MEFASVNSPLQNLSEHTACKALTMCTLRVHYDMCAVCCCESSSYCMVIAALLATERLFVAHSAASYCHHLHYALTVLCVQRALTALCVYRGGS